MSSGKPSFEIGNLFPEPQVNGRGLVGAILTRSPGRLAGKGFGVDQQAILVDGPLDFDVGQDHVVRSASRTVTIS